MEAKDFTIRPGLIIVGNGHDWSAWLQHVVTGKALDGRKATHGCNTTFPTGSRRQISLVLSAEINGAVHIRWEEFCSDPKYDFWIYEVIGITEEEINHALDYDEVAFLNVPYAYLAWPWFGWRALCNRVINPLGKKLGLKWLYHDTNKENNWWTHHVFCTKQEWLHMDEFSELHPEKWGKWREELHNLLPDTFSPIDLTNMLINYPDIFRLIAKQENGVFSVI